MIGLAPYIVERFADVNYDLPPITNVGETVRYPMFMIGYLIFVAHFASRVPSSNMAGDALLMENVAERIIRFVRKATEYADEVANRAHEYLDPLFLAERTENLVVLMREIAATVNHLNNTRARVTNVPWNIDQLTLQELNTSIDHLRGTWDTLYHLALTLDPSLAFVLTGLA